MMDQLLTSDNLGFPDPTFLQTEKLQTIATDRTATEFANNCNMADRRHLRARVSALVEQSLAANTRTAYRRDFERFLAWGGSVPADPDTIACYLAAHVDTHAPATLKRWLSSISQAHVERGLTSPVGSALVRATVRGIRRCRGTSQRRAAPLTAEILTRMLECLDTATLAGLRDRALLVVGFGGGFRRSELTNIEVSDISLGDFPVVLLRRSKTDQIASGRKISLDMQIANCLSARVVKEWLDAANITVGPLFRPVDRWGNVADGRLSGEAVAQIVKQHANRIGLPAAEFSGHSLRAGYITSAANTGVPTWRIQRQTGHKCLNVLHSYIREEDR